MRFRGMFTHPLLAPSPRDCFAGHGTCSCGRCVCERGWFGELCQHPRECNLTEEQSKSLCESADGILCSGKGEYPCRSSDRVPDLTHGLYGLAYRPPQTAPCRNEKHAALGLSRTSDLKVNRMTRHLLSPASAVDVTVRMRTRLSSPLLHPGSSSTPRKGEEYQLPFKNQL
ncbi:hypothetical protein GH733_006515 [Mirounga leonina]|nr:hypothetical protein GH733_006515 [Mirounga leonina]